MAESNESLAEILADYQTVITVYVTTNVAVQRVLPINSRRWYVRFFSDSLSGFFNGLFPGPPMPPIPAVAMTGRDMEYHFRDCPSIVGGEWYLYGAAPNQNIYCVQSLYMR